MSSKKRQYPRVASDISVTVKVAGRGKVATGRIRNISLGGVFIEMEPLAFGSELELSFNLPSGPTLRCDGYVMWSTKDKPPTDGMHGTGVRLSNISVADMRLLAEYIEGELAR